MPMTTLFEYSRRYLLGACCALSIAGCSSSSDDSSGSSDDSDGGGGSVSVANYTGTASVGDFITIELASDSGSLSYHNHTNGDSGTATYTVDADGVYQIIDPNGKLIRAMEVPGFALVIEGHQIGPNSDTDAIITAVLQTDIALSDLQGKDFNFLQFSTSRGGIEIGHASFDDTGSLSLNNYVPFVATENTLIGRSENPYRLQNPAFPASSVVAGPDGNYMQVGSDTETSYMFRTTGGFFAVDTPMGSVVCLEQQSTSDFQSAWAGSYASLVYMQTFQLADTGSEIEEQMLEKDIVTATFTVSESGTISIAADGDSGTMDIVMDAAITPLATYDSDDADTDPDFVASGKLEDPCEGLFVVEIPETDGVDSYTRQVFVTFIDGALILGSYAEIRAASISDNRMQYLYGFGLKGTTAAATPEAVAQQQRQLRALGVRLGLSAQP